MKFLFRIFALTVLVYLTVPFTSCKKDKFLTDPASKLEFSQDSILFDTVFTTIGSSTRNFRIRNTHGQKLLITSIMLEGGTASPFKLNVDGVPGTQFSDLEIAAGDSMYVFVQVKVNPTNVNSPLIISDNIIFTVNGNIQKMPLEAWGQDAYYHYPTDALKFKDGSYLPYSYLNNDTNAISVTWPNDKPHVIYGYLVVYNKQKLRMDPGTRVYLNYKAGLWVYPGGELKVLGQKGKEVVFQGARREKDYTDEPGQWDRIWINEGSNDNIIDYAIIKNGYIGVQCELFSDDSILAKKRLLTISNTKIQNMSLWGIYGFAYQILGANNVVSNCQEHSLNILMGGGYSFVHCTFANYWNKGKVREKTTINVNNHSTQQVIPLYFYMGNCIVDGRLENEITMDLKADPVYTYTYGFSNSWLKTNINTSSATNFTNNVIGDKNATPHYKDLAVYDFSPHADENRFSVFVHPRASADASYSLTVKDINAKPRLTTTVTAGAYEKP